MRLGLIIQLAFLGLCATGCARETLPEDSFRLTSREVFADETERVVVLRLEAATQQMYTVTIGAARLECQLTNSEADDGVFQSEIWLFASRLPPDANGHEHARIYLRGGDGQPIHTKTNLRASTRFTNVVEMATGTPLEKLLAVEQTNHVGKLDSPVVIARLAGQAARLLLGPAALTIRKP